MREDKRVTTMQELATVPLEELADRVTDPGDDAVLAAIIRRLTDPAERDKLTVSKFQSAL